MQKISTMRMTGDNILKGDKFTIGIDLGDRSSSYCVLNEAGDIVLDHELATTAEAMKEAFRSDATEPDGPGDGKHILSGSAGC